MTLKIAHISDPHYAKPDWNIKQFFSKRWVGNLNAALFGDRSFDYERPESLIKMFCNLGVTHVVISGDVSTTSAKREFVQARSYVDRLNKAGLKTIVIPGNHDNYTWMANKRKEFYRYFEHPVMSRDSVCAEKIEEGWWVVCVDTTLPTPIYKSTGLFSPKIARNLANTLESIPSEDNVIVVNHYPLFANDAPLRSLEGAKDMQKVLSQFPNIQLYLHGHSHRHCVADLRKNKLPIILDSGSVSLKNRSSWNLIDIETTGCHIKKYSWDEPSAKWESKKDFAFSW